jgi:SAM-dependent methyltransferase
MVTIELTAPYRDLVFMTPLSEERAGRLVDFVGFDLNGLVVDIGCGWAELLLRAVAGAPQSHGLGVDLDTEAIEHGRRLAVERGLTDLVTLSVADAKTVLPDAVDAVICIGASHVWNPPSDENLPMGYARALDAIRARVSRGARVVYGEGIWSQPPTAAAIAPLGGRLDEMVSLAELVEIAVAAGFMPMAVHEADAQEWDDFESGYSACYARWLAEHAVDHPDAEEVGRKAKRQRDAYFRGYRGILGMAYLQLLAV